MNTVNLTGLGRKRMWSISGYYPDIYLDDFRKTTNKINQKIPTWDLPTQVRALALELTCSIA